MSLIQSLPASPLDIVGDIHGEYDALVALLHHLGYDRQGNHPQGRNLVFVGDFCDRGPNSPAVLTLAQSLVKSGRATSPARQTVVHPARFRTSTHLPNCATPTSAPVNGMRASPAKPFSRTTNRGRPDRSQCRA
ncbi:MAG: hypothetical protein FGM55_12490, partial [Rhodoferax sp.]|nr:hypothetical protein [Rhodoferax sp.]